MSISFWIVSRWSSWIIGCPPPPSMKKTSVRAPSKTDSSSGQPPATKTGSTPGTSARHLASSLQPALNSWSPGPWLGRPATRTILAVSAAAADAESDQAARAAKCERKQLPHGGLPHRSGRSGVVQDADEPRRRTKRRGSFVPRQGCRIDRSLLRIVMPRAQISSVTPGLGTGGSSIGPQARVLGKVSSLELSACSQETALPV